MQVSRLALFPRHKSLVVECTSQANACSVPLVNWKMHTVYAMAIGITFLCHGYHGGRGIGSVPLSFPALPPCQRHWFCAGLGIMVSLYVCVWGACWAGVRHVGSMPFALSVPNAVAGTLYTVATIGLCIVLKMQLLREETVHLPGINHCLCFLKCWKLMNMLRFFIKISQNFIFTWEFSFEWT